MLTTSFRFIRAMTAVVLSAACGGNTVLEGKTGTPIDGGAIAEGALADAAPRNTDGGPPPACLGCVVTLAAYQAEPVAIAVGAGNVYWSDNNVPGGLMSVPSTGGTLTTLASDVPGEMVVDSTNVYWATFGAVKSVPVGGGSETTLTTGSNFASPIAIDGTSVFWGTQTEDGTGSILTVPVGGGSPTTLTTGLATGTFDLYAVAFDSTRVFWSGTMGTTPPLN